MNVSRSATDFAQFARILPDSVASLRLTDGDLRLRFIAVVDVFVRRFFGGEKS